jgi:hypothetical protein
MPVNSALQRLRQKDCEFKACLGYIARPFLKKNKVTYSPGPKDFK